jgi:hypothetical protein
LSIEYLAAIEDDRPRCKVAIAFANPTAFAPDDVSEI